MSEFEKVRTLEKMMHETDPNRIAIQTLLAILDGDKSGRKLSMRAAIDTARRYQKTLKAGCEMDVALGKLIEKAISAERERSSYHGNEQGRVTVNKPGRDRKNVAS